MAVYEPGADVNGLLDEAVQRLIPVAIGHRHGILVTQLDYGKYAVEVDANVPCGLVEEKKLGESLVNSSERSPAGASLVQ
ncbi:hypothetical protein HWD94_02425 [Pseudarthrobacter equi]|uniref:hypothetical protein n=1 Tax=Pseudarthrobacter equi TaxID=728066 RepID=UPI0021C0C33E|nr:hypothetical protein [Pseudarthrobacter equi]MCT9623978.1 hypothetical protein [Pseudarthrobacter equi]